MIDVIQLTKKQSLSEKLGLEGIRPANGHQDLIASSPK
jgi:hypothetical protein